jgi:molybdate transport system substrate-binding protein
MNLQRTLSCLLLVCGMVASAWAQANEPVLCLVAASAQDVVKELGDQFEASTKTPVKITPGPSQQLAKQAISGAPADLFLSASQEWAEQVAKEGLAAKSVPLLTNDLVLVVPKGNPAGIKSPQDLTSDKVRKIALAGENVPAGKYAQQALTALGLYDALVSKGKIARGQDVRFTLTFVDRGEAEAGIVYSTDARVSTNVEVVYTFDRQNMDKIVYPLVLLKHGSDRAGAQKFFDYLQSDEAKKVFEKHGFVRLER